jgi:ligand-binding sensor domain-containing protein/anti-sigma regulatory factor (Ser/Thr protein kinase)
VYKYFAILYLCLCSLSIDSIAQEIPHFIEKLTTEEGLSSNKINDIAQDTNGFLWIATSDGLNRFDGTEVTQYYHQENVNSLPHNYVYCLKKLPGNNIAIGTEGGLCFYNSNTGIFRNFYYSQNNQLDEYNNSISRLEIDNNGNLWVGSRNCIYIFDTQLKLKKTIASPFTAADAARGRLKFVEKILPLSDGDVLLYLYNGWNIYSARTTEVTSLTNSSYREQLKFLNEIILPRAANKNEKYFPPANVFKIFDRYFLFIKPGVDSLFLFDEQGRKSGDCFFPYNKYPYILWSQQVSTLDSATLLLSFHNYGLAVIPLSWENNQLFIHQPSSLLFETYEYGTTLRDQQGNWWLATVEEGLQKASPYKQHFKSTTLVNNYSGKPVKYDIASVNRYNNALWIGTYGEGVFEFNLLSGKTEQHDLSKTVHDSWANFIWNIRQVSPDTLWIGTQTGMIWYCISTKKYGRIPAFPGKPGALDSVSVTTQFVDSHGLVWMGLGLGKGVCCFDSKDRHVTYYPGSTPDGYPLRYPLNIAEDKKGNLWFVSDASTVLVYWNRNTARFQTIPLSMASQKQTGNLQGIWYESDSALWLGTVTSGLIKFNISANSITVYGHDKGLSNSHISSIYEDNEKRLWLVTDGSLSCFDQRTDIFTNYSSKDGLPVKYPTASFYYDSMQQRLYNGGPGAIFYFDPGFMNTYGNFPKTIITAMQVNGQPYMFKDQPGRFSSIQNDIAIHYTAIDLTNGRGTKYAYKLIGEDTGWIIAGNQRQINFSHLAPGNYTFMVRAANSNGIWSTQTASLHFYIRPPFTQTAWFYALIILAIAGIFYVLYRFRLGQLMRTEQMRSEISKNLHDEVGSTLTNISLGSLLAQKQLHNEGSVNRILERIYQDSQNVSEAMREIVWSINPKIDTLGEALPRMLHYASELLEAKGIELQAEIAPAIENLKLTMQRRRDLYLIFKETVNNLAKHSQATQVIINFHLLDNILIMIVSDNGKGFDMSIPLINNGLKNMQERAESHQWQLHINSKPGAGATITLKARIA